MTRKIPLLRASIVVLAILVFLTSSVWPIKVESRSWFDNSVQANEAAKTSILVLVNETIYPAIVDHLAVFEQDLESSGYNVLVSTIGNGLSPPEIKNIIKSYYVDSNISGCILVGDVKAAYSEMRTGDYSNASAEKIWVSLDACDMYYMDLDGYWENVTNPDFYAHEPSNVVEVNLYDSCSTFYNEYIVYMNETKKWDYNTIENKTQYRAEIWVSRIMAHNLLIGGSSESGWKNETANGSNGTGVPPNLTVFAPSFSELNVSVNGVVYPGTPGTTITRIHWDWGDGNSEDHWFPSYHSYAGVGQYTIRVTAYQSDGLNATEYNQISISLPESEAQVVNDYLERDHNYRSGVLQVSSKAYILNAGSGYNDQGMNYSGMFRSIVEQENVTRDDFMTCIGNPEGSRLTYLTAHSWPQGHALYDGSITTDDLQNANKTSIFYILNACSACRWDQYVTSPTNPNYLGGLYAFDSNPDRRNYGLCATGFSGVGGFNNLHYFTDYLNSHPNSSYAEAYKYWFNENLMINFAPNNYVVLGDPTLLPSVRIIPEFPSLFILPLFMMATLLVVMAYRRKHASAPKQADLCMHKEPTDLD